MRALVTGGAGFIGSHLTDALVMAGHEVTVLDDLSTGRREHVHRGARLVEGSVVEPRAVAAAVAGADVVFHLAALGAVARSVADPAATDSVNVHGTVGVLTAARDSGVRRVVYASSSSVYGGSPVLPTPESAPPRPRSPYAVSKLAGEWYCRVFGELFPLDTVVLRYFNVFGPRQRPDSIYAAVVPRFMWALIAGERPVVYGDGLQSRDFTFVDDVVAANLRAADAPADVSGKVYNVAPGRTHTVLELLDTLADIVGVRADPVFAEPRPGDVRQSCADPSAATAELGWRPRVPLRDGLVRSVEWLTRERRGRHAGREPAA